MLPYTRKVTSLSVGRHTWSLQAIGSTGVNLTLTTEFFIKGWQRDVLVAMGSYFNTSARVWGKLIARLNLGCSYVMVGGSTLIVSCLPSDPLASSACSIDSEVPQPCKTVTHPHPHPHNVVVHCTCDTAMQCYFVCCRTLIQVLFHTRGTYPVYPHVPTL